MFLKSLPEIILWVLPGFIALQIYRQKYPTKIKTDTIFITWSVIIGVFITNLYSIITGNVLIKDGETLPSFSIIEGILVSGVIVGLFFVLLHNLRFKIGVKKGWKILVPDSISIWAKINQKWNKDWAIIFLDDKVNSIYMGNIKYYRFDPDKDDNDFLLGQAKRVDKNLKVLYEIDGIGVYLNTRDVKRIEFIKGKK